MAGWAPEEGAWDGRVLLGWHALQLDGCLSPAHMLSI